MSSTQSESFPELEDLMAAFDDMRIGTTPVGCGVDMENVVLHHPTAPETIDVFVVMGEDGGRDYVQDEDSNMDLQAELEGHSTEVDMEHGAEPAVTSAEPRNGMVLDQEAVNEILDETIERLHRGEFDPAEPLDDFLMELDQWFEQSSTTDCEMVTGSGRPTRRWWNLRWPKYPSRTRTST